MITGVRKELANGLFYGDAVRFGVFRLKLHEKHPDAPLSPIYIDLRVLRSLPQCLKLAAHACRLVISAGQIMADYFADVPTSITPVVAVLSSQTDKPMISPRMDVKTHGLTRSIDGIFERGRSALLIDDLVTTADSKLEVISILEENGLVVQDVVVIVDREQGGAQKLRELGYNCHAVFTLSELLNFYEQSELITQETHKRVVEYLQAPQLK